jgi:PIN domain nuclease of toxin-antitoxin system
VKLILDSQALFIVTFELGRMPAKARAAIENADVTLVSTISPYELELKKALGKLGFPRVNGWQDVITAQGLVSLPVDVRHSVAAAGLPLLHRDPWGRLIVAQAQMENADLVSSDRMLARYGVNVVW